MQEIAFFIRTRAWVMAVLLSVVTYGRTNAQQQAGKAQPPDKKIEASGYLAQADRDLECDPERAKSWAKKALDLVSSAREAEQAMIDTLGDLKSQSNIKIVEAGKRIDLFNESAREARGFIKRAKLETASGRFQRDDPKACYAGFKSLRFEIEERKSKAEVLIKQGDAAASRRLKQAIKFYVNAGRIDVEYPGLDQRINDAKHGRTPLQTRAGVVSGGRSALGQTTAAHSLIELVRRGDLAALRTRLSSGASPNETDDALVKGWTPLMEAANKGDVEAARLLLDSGAAINAKTERFGSTALDIAIAGGKSGVISLLRSRGGPTGGTSASGRPEPAMADYVAGEQALRKHDYPTAIRNFRPLADQGDTAHSIASVSCTRTALAFRRTIKKLCGCTDWRRRRDMRMHSLALA